MNGRAQSGRVGMALILAGNAAAGPAVDPGGYRACFRSLVWANSA